MSDAPGQANAASPPPWSPADRAVLDTVRAALYACDEGLDPTVMRALKEALLQVVPFNTMSLHVEDVAHASFCVLFREAAGEAHPSVFTPGVRIPRSDALARAQQARPVEVRVMESVDPSRNPIDAAVYAAGVRSYVTTPILHQGAAIGWLTLAHYEAGAPSQKHAPLLRELARLLAPALARWERLARGRLFGALVEASPDGMLALDRAGTVMEANGAAQRLLRRGREQLLGRPVDDVLGGDAGHQVAVALQRPLHPVDVPIDIDLGGERIAIDAIVARVQGSAEASYQVHLRDARARRAAEEATARRVDQLAFLRGLAESMAGDMRVQTALERAAAFCMKRSAIGGVALFRTNADGSLALVAARGVSTAAEARLQHVTPRELEEHLTSRAPSGAVKRNGMLIEVVGAPLDADTTGEVPRWKMIVPLMHARRPLGAMLVLGRPGAAISDAERDLWQSVAGTVSAALHAAADFEHVVALEAEKRQLVDNLPVIVARLDPKTGDTLFANGAVERVLGFTPSELQGSPGMDGLFADPIEWEASAIARDRAARGMDNTWQDRRYRHKDGRLLTLRENVYPVRDATGAVRAIEVIAYDVTTELESRKQLMQADRLASLGSLAAGIAHEINNPIAFIQLAAGQLGKMVDQTRAGDPSAPERAKELVREVGEAAGRIANIVGELKLFTRIPEGAHVTPVDLNRIVQMAVTLTSAELRRRARLEMSLGELPLVPGEYASLGHAFVNLLINAAQAIDAKGPTVAPNFVRVSTGMQDGAIVVRVSDTGVGIEPRLLPRIFDPFFKTKTGSEGAGLGLAITNNLVRRLGGDVRVTSEPGEGTTFEVVLPPEPQADLASRLTPSGSLRSAPPSHAEPSPSSAPSPRGRVLIVDDEQSLAKALARQLSSRYDVDTVSTASDALAELSVRTYDVVVCDLRMPDQSGPSIYDAIVARSPRQAERFIFTTGGSYGDVDDEIHDRAQSTGRPILEKPFDGATFEKLVADVAARSRGSSVTA